MRIVRLVRRFADDQQLGQLLEIAEDGQITDAEKPIFTDITNALSEIVESALALSFAGIVEGQQ